MEDKNSIIDEPTWVLLKEVDVPAAPPSVWTRAIDYLATVKTLKFESNGTWTYDQQNICGPDGIPIGNPTDLMMNDVPLGCVIGKVGGSTAASKDGTTFVVGSFALYTPSPVLNPATGAGTPLAGPLFLAMNTNALRYSGQSGTMKVKIYQKGA
jgi:hypothetical protein